MAYVEGKVYLRDKRNGNIYPFERYLSADRNFEPVIPNQVSEAAIKLVIASPPQTVEPTKADSLLTVDLDGLDIEELVQEKAAHVPLPHE